MSRSEQRAHPRAPVGIPHNGKCQHRAGESPASSYGSAVSNPAPEGVESQGWAP